MPIDDRLARLEERAANMEIQIVEARTQLAEARADIKEVLVTIQGPPRDESLRGRIHMLESDRAAAMAARAAVDLARSVNDNATAKRWTNTQKRLAIGIAAAAAIGPYIQPYIH